MVIIRLLGLLSDQDSYSLSVSHLIIMLYFKAKLTPRFQEDPIRLQCKNSFNWSAVS